MSAVEILQQLKRLTSKYQTPFGIAVWGFTAPGEAKEILVDAEGRLQVAGEFTGTVEVPNIDVLLSSRASESTLASVKSQTDKLSFDASNRLAIQNPPNLDVLLSTRASETTLASVLTKLDVALSTRASETTLSSILSQLDITLSALRDALRGAGNKTLTDLDTDLVNIYARLDVTLSTRASEATLSGIKIQTDKLTFDVSNRLKTQLDSIPNPSNLDIAMSTLRDDLLAGTPTYPGGLDDIYNKLNSQLDVLLSTRASESTLSSIKTKTDNLDVALSTRLGSDVSGIPDDSPPSKGIMLHGFDGSLARRVKVTSDGKLLCVLG